MKYLDMDKLEIGNIYLCGFYSYSGRTMILNYEGNGIFSKPTYRKKTFTFSDIRYVWEIREQSSVE